MKIKVIIFCIINNSKGVKKVLEKARSGIRTGSFKSERVVDKYLEEKQNSHPYFKVEHTVLTGTGKRPIIGRGK